MTYSEFSSKWSHMILLFASLLLLYSLWQSVLLSSFPVLNTYSTYVNKDSTPTRDTYCKLCDRLARRSPKPTHLSLDFSPFSLLTDSITPPSSSWFVNSLSGWCFPFCHLVWIYSPMSSLESWQEGSWKRSGGGPSVEKLECSSRARHRFTVQHQQEQLYEHVLPCTCTCRVINLKEFQESEM